MKSYVRQAVREGDICQCHKHETLVSPRLLQPLLVPEKVWKDITMDFIEGLPSI